MNILVLNCDFDPEPATNGGGIIEQYLKKNHRVEVVRVQCFEQEFPTELGLYQGVIITGSRASVYENLPWISHLKEVVRAIDEKGIPLFGICFGLQVLADALGGYVEKSGRFEEGFRTIVVDTTHWLFEGMPAECVVYQSHGDVILKLPERAQVLSQSWCCEAFCLRNSVGVQFHPEITRAVAERMAERDGVVLDTHLCTSQTSAVGSLCVFDNFVAFCAQQEVRRK